jgi:murein DD-endopeptidase MepM/ murein hydrolase activator NlpD
MAKYREPFPKSKRGDRFGDLSPYRNGHKHRGQDWVMPERTLIPAITNGKVTDKFYSEVIGWVVEQSTEDGLFVQYAHLWVNPKTINIGDTIIIGRPIGRVGKTGSAATGNHLHISISKVKHGHLAPYEKLIDPLVHITENKE